MVIKRGKLFTIFSKHTQCKNAYLINHGNSYDDMEQRHFKH